MSDIEQELTTEEVAPANTDWLGLHPLSLVVNLAPRTWRTIRSSWPLLAAMVIGGRRDSGGLLFVVGLFFTLAVFSTIVHFFTLSYRVVDGRLQMRTGLLNRQDRIIDASRVQNTELVRNPLHKLFGLVEVRIETASGRKIKNLLSALSVRDGEALIAALDAARAKHRARDPDNIGVLLNTADLSDLLRYGATGLRLGAGIAIAVGLGMEGLQFIDVQRLDSVPKIFGGLGSAAIVIAFVSGLFVIAVASSVQRFWGFTLRSIDGRLLATQGLLTKRRSELQIDKVQLLTVKQPLLRRVFRFATVHVETAAAQDGERGTSSAEAVVPVVDNDDIEALLDGIVPQAGQLWLRTLRRAHPNALKRDLFRAIMEGIGLALLLGFWFGGLWWSLLLIAPSLNGAMQYLDFRHQGWLVTRHVVVARRGFIHRQTHILSRRKIQSIEARQGPLLRRYGLSRVVIRVAGSRVLLPLVGTAEAHRLVDALNPTARPVAYAELVSSSP